jgi:hypothetical protein
LTIRSLLFRQKPYVKNSRLPTKEDKHEQLDILSTEKTVHFKKKKKKKTLMLLLMMKRSDLFVSARVVKNLWLEDEHTQDMEHLLRESSDILQRRKRTKEKKLLHLPVVCLADIFRQRLHSKYCGVFAVPESSGLATAIVRRRRRASNPLPCKSIVTILPIWCIKGQSMSSIQLRIRM